MFITFLDKFYVFIEHMFLCLITVTVMALLFSNGLSKNSKQGDTIFGLS